MPDDLAQRVAVFKRVPADVRHAGRNLHPLEGAAVVERTRADGFDAGADRRVGHRVARPECRAADVGNAGGNGNRLQGACVAERAFANIAETAIAGYLERLQLGTAAKGVVKQRADAGNRDVLHGLA